MATPNYDVNYDDKRFTQVEADKKAAIAESDKTYDSMINQSDKFYQQQIDASKEYAETQKKNQQAQTDFAIEQIEQQKEQANKDYLKEQSGAYVDWQKQSNQYGANSEKIAAGGLANAGFSESSQVSMYNTYQNRVATAREAYSRAVLNYNNAIKDARLQNNSALAEIAYNALQQQLQLSLEGFQYKNSLIIEKANKRQELDNTYYNRYQDVLKQINTENALAEEVRQYNESLAEERRQYNASHSLQQAELKLAQDKFAYQKAQDAKAAAQAAIKKSSSSGSKKQSSSYSSARKEQNAVKNAKKTTKTQQASVSAYDYLNKLISSGASKDKVSNEIALALRDGAITKAEATKLRSTFTPRGIQY